VGGAEGRAVGRQQDRLQAPAGGAGVVGVQHQVCLPAPRLRHIGQRVHEGGALGPQQGKGPVFSQAI